MYRHLLFENYEEMSVTRRSGVLLLVMSITFCALIEGVYLSLRTFLVRNIVHRIGSINEEEGENKSEVTDASAGSW